MFQFRPTIILISVILLGTAVVAQDKVPDWWHRTLSLDRIELPKDRLCSEFNLVDSSIGRLPINIVYPRLIEGKNIIRGINPMLSEKEETWIRVRREKEWEPLTTLNSKGTVAEYVRHYSNQAGSYQLTFVDSLPVLTVESEKDFMKQIQCKPITRQGITLYDIGNEYHEYLISFGLTFFFISLGPGTHPNDVEFDIDFEGGDLPHLLCAVASQINTADPYHFCSWSIGGSDVDLQTANETRTIIFSSRSRDQVERLLTE